MSHEMPRGRSLRRLLGVALVVSFAMGPALAHAQDESKRAAARILATDGLKAFEEGRWEAAIDQFMRAEALVHAPPHLLYVARSFVKLGKLGKAQETYEKITSEELPPRAPKAFVEAKKAATEEKAALEPRVPKLTIVVEGGVAGETVVTLDGEEVAPERIGVPHPADPGTHVLAAKAPGWTSDSVKVTLAEGGSETAKIVLVPAPTSAPVTTAPDALGPSGRRGVSVPTWIALGVGVAGLGAGTFFVLRNHAARSEADSLCTGGICPAARRPEIESLDREADMASTFAWIGYGVGAAGLLTGVTLLFVDGPLSSKRSATANIHPWVGAGAAGVTGRF